MKRSQDDFHDHEDSKRPKTRSGRYYPVHQGYPGVIDTGDEQKLQERTGVELWFKTALRWLDRERHVCVWEPQPVGSHLWIRDWEGKWIKSAITRDRVASWSMCQIFSPYGDRVLSFEPLSFEPKPLPLE